MAKARHTIIRLTAELKKLYDSPGDIGTQPFSLEALQGAQLTNVHAPLPWESAALVPQHAQRAELAGLLQRTERCHEEQALVRREAIDQLAFHDHYVDAIQVFIPSFLSTLSRILFHEQQSICNSADFCTLFKFDLAYWATCLCAMQSLVLFEMWSYRRLMSPCRTDVIATPLAMLSQEAADHHEHQ